MLLTKSFLEAMPRFATTSTGNWLNPLEEVMRHMEQKAKRTEQMRRYYVKSRERLRKFRLKRKSAKQ